MKLMFYLNTKFGYNHNLNTLTFSPSLIQLLAEHPEINTNFQRLKIFFVC